MKKLILTLIVLFAVVFANAQGPDCGGADPFCTGQTYQYPASVNVPNLGAVGCLGSSPNPAWYWMQVGTAGNIDIHMASNSGYDIDFICWGPFTSLSAGCATNLMTSNSYVDCSYSTAGQEDCNIPNAQVGQVYILLITNYSNAQSDFIFSQTGGSGATDCGIMAPPITGDVVCVGQTIQLTVNNPTAGATYNWTGPGGWTSNVMNATRPGATPAMAGTYTLTITVGGQTSPPTTCTVTVNPNPTITITPANPTTCPGAPITLTGNCSTGTATYNWSNSTTGATTTVSPTVPTTYTVTGTDANGCSATGSILVNISPNLNITVNPATPSICLGGSVSITASGGTTYAWTPSATLSSGTGATVTASPTVQTTYTVTGSSTGCTGSTTVTVSINSNLTISVTPTNPTTCPGAPINLTAAGASTYVWSPTATLSAGTGTTVAATPTVQTTYTVVGTGIGGCTGSATVTVGISPNIPITVTPANPSTCPGMPISLTASGGDTYVWSPTATLSAGTGATVSATPLVQTTYSVVGTAISGCTGTTTVTVAISANLPISVTPANPTTCPGAPIALTASGAATYVWSPTATLSASTGATVTASPPAQTTYTVVGTDLSGCMGSTTVTVMMNPNLQLFAPSINICIGTSGTISASGADTYLWSPAATLSSDTGSSVIASPLVTTTYTVEGNANGCTGSTMVTVNLVTGPQMSITASPPAICPGDTSTLTAMLATGTAQTFTWTPNTSLLSASGQITHAFPNTTTTYTVVADNNGCISTAEYTLVFSPLPTVDFTADIREGCQGLEVHFTDLTTPAVNQWYWTFGNNITYGDYSYVQNPIHYFENAGVYDVTLSVISVDGCKTSLTYNDYIVTHPIPSADFSATPNIVNELEGLVWFTDQSVGADVWNWNFDDNNIIGNTSSLQNPTHIYADTGYYHPILIVFSDYGCSDTTIRQVYIEPNFAFYVPNAFTPNDDGKNQNFAPRGEGIRLATFQMHIYDRWGKQVFNTVDMEKGWNGKVGGKAPVEGVYSWLISFYDINRKFHAYKGSVVLIK